MASHTDFTYYNAGFSVHYIQHKGVTYRRKLPGAWKRVDGDDVPPGEKFYPMHPAMFAAYEGNLKADGVI